MFMNSRTYRSIIILHFLECAVRIHVIIVYIVFHGTAESKISTQVSVNDCDTTGRNQDHGNACDLNVSNTLPSLTGVKSFISVCV